jgi:hypothetical protein
MSEMSVGAEAGDCGGALRAVTEHAESNIARAASKAGGRVMCSE